MGIVLTDPAFTATTFVVIDFEALTPAGQPPVPIEVAAIAGRFTEEGDWAESGRFQSLMRPPDDVPFTSSGQALTGLTGQALAGQPPAGEVMAALSARLAKPPYRLVAHSAHRGHGDRRTAPALPEAGCHQPAMHGEALPSGLPRTGQSPARLRFLGIPIPPGRHRAMPDAELTVQVLKRALAAGQECHLWATLRDLDALAGVAPRPAATGADDAPVQEALF